MASIAATPSAMTRRAGLARRTTPKSVALSVTRVLGGFSGRRGAPGGDPVPVVVAERARLVLRQRVAVPLAVGGAHEGGHDLQVPLRDVGRLPPEVGQAEVDVELEQIDAGWALGHEKSVGMESDDATQPTRRHVERAATLERAPMVSVLRDG